MPASVVSVRPCDHPRLVEGHPTSPTKASCPAATVSPPYSDQRAAGAAASSASRNDTTLQPPGEQGLHDEAELAAVARVEDRPESGVQANRELPIDVVLDRRSEHGSHEEPHRRR